MHRHLGPLLHLIRTLPSMLLEITRVPGQLTRQEADWNALVKRIPQLIDYPLVSPTIEQHLRPAYNEYVSGVSSPLISLSLNRAAFCFLLSKAVGARKILDLGSGFSTYTFKRYCTEYTGDIISVDDSKQWLKITADFLASHQLNTEGLMTLTDFINDKCLTRYPFDLCLLDIGDFSLRQQLLPELINAARMNNAVLVVDDFHVGAYRSFVFETCKKFGVHIYSARKYTRRRLSHAAVIIT